MRRPTTPSLIWEGHRAGREIGYCHLEKLHNLDQLPSKGFTISCFPVKIRAASAGWTRAIAIIDWHRAPDRSACDRIDGRARLTPRFPCRYHRAAKQGRSI